MPSPNLKISSSAQAAASMCAAFVLDFLRETLRTKETASFAISGGSTPKLMFADFARAGFDWSKVHLFWVDERCVPPTDSQSNFKLANDPWLTPAKFPEENIHRIYGELEPAAGAHKYVEDIRQYFGLPDWELPEFDVIHRGMGPDAHTASLFPGDPLINDRSRIATNVWVEKMKMHRVTLLPGMLIKARQTVLQVSGADKADAAHQVLTEQENWLKYPCQMASRDEKATWFMDEAAAAKLT